MVSQQPWPIGSLHWPNVAPQLLFVGMEWSHVYNILPGKQHMQFAIVIYGCNKVDAVESGGMVKPAQLQRGIISRAIYYSSV